MTESRVTQFSKEPFGEPDYMWVSPFLMEACVFTKSLSPFQNSDE